MGLPPKFDKWRGGQEEALHVMITGQTRADIICAPTGFGKSVLPVAYAKLTGLPTCIVTESRGLQDQYLDDFQGIGMVDLRGRRNYKCDMRPDDPEYTCEDGYASQCPYKGTVQCKCSQAEMRAATSNLVVTNYDKWTASRRFGQGLEHIQQVVFDEFHAAPEALARAMQITLNTKEVEEGLKLDFLTSPENQEMSNWKMWANMARSVANDAMIAAQARITGVSDPKPSWVRHFSHMRNLCRRIATLATARPADWIVEEVEGGKGFQFDPIRPGRYAEIALLLKVPRVIGISATTRPKTGYMVGLSRDKFGFKEFDSDFDPKRCPIYYVPTMRVDSYAENLDPLWNKLDQIASKRRDRKGIVHTVSYDRQAIFKAKSRFGSSVMINRKGEPIGPYIEEFRESGPGTIFASPSVGTGYDFPGDDCRWQFMVKIPFEPPSKIVKAREADDPEYRSYKAMQALVQAFGRDMRSKRDWSERFIGDSHLEWFLPRYKHLAPRSFHGFFKPVNVVPQPPKLGSM